mmetsp:Transcript_63684/g.103156  ORF Transcript_63684/g.103156 Transcript_63684/m.103156 type:complete len:114 (-) Transcript_63684:63-404(-)|eukprot:CAMPEP_0115078202 /NCGR_PEP_ID=MMETSP0227-20121206/17426_1 /TAXON_ID=89957 /ORGANISM="Polarella glacialis, Strain CCMP 1383" /LENGTH=113 /DNA_ID=CAMNT_0002465577 /DNA_START=77 /DNA_END=418 /DNA_ORIENTATION=-
MAEAELRDEGAFPSQYDESGMTSFDKVEADLRGDALRLICEMPTGEILEIRCNVGHDVAYAKGQLARQTEIPYSDIKLFLDEKLMFDPLSFNDFPAIMALASKEVRVKVEISQ